MIGHQILNEPRTAGLSQFGRNMEEITFNNQGSNTPLTGRGVNIISEKMEMACI